MSNIIQGDNGTILEFIVKDDNGIVDLSSATSVTFRMQKSRNIYSEKVGTITDPVNGKCQITLNSDDTSESGKFAYQVTVLFMDNTNFSSNVNILTIDRKL
jgi:hypothetical protein